MKFTLIIYAALIASLSLAQTAWAEKGGNGHGSQSHKHSSHKQKNGHAHKYKSSHDRVIITDSNRVVIKEYISHNYHSNCPPGLAKKHNGCLPPGQAKKLYRVGYTLPSTVVWEPVPQSLLVRLDPVPMGYQYVMVDRDVLLVSEASHKVIDAITLLSAVGR